MILFGAKRKRFRQILAAAALSPRARAEFLAYAFLKEFFVPKRWPLHLAKGAVWLTQGGWPYDHLLIYEIFLDETYLTDYRGSVVIDAGAHKGLYGAYALQQGAEAVFSYEPEDANYEHLARTAQDFRSRGGRWQTCHAAVGSHAGFGTLYVRSQSWSHTLIAPSKLDYARPTVVPVLAMSDIVEQAATRRRRVIVKLDVEGSECEAILKTDPSTWQKVQEIFVEIHSFARCTHEDLSEHLGMAGFSLASRRGRGIDVSHFVQLAPELHSLRHAPAVCSQLRVFQS